MFMKKFLRIFVVRNPIIFPTLATMVLENFIVTTVPDTVIYLPNFISQEEEREILDKVYSAPKPKWTQLKNRRLQNWGGIPHPKGMIPEKIPQWLQKYLDKISVLQIFQEKNLPNHVLINEYTAGQGIMPHTDGPLFHPVVSTINCGSYTFLQFKSCDRNEIVEEINEKLNRDTFALLLEPRSLLVLKDDVYKKYVHGIEEVEGDVVDDRVRNLHNCGNKYENGQHLTRTTRISLTIRNVPRCCNFKLKF